MAYTVYKHTGPNGKVYIGITKKKPYKRWDNGKGYAHCPHMNAAVQKYGWENFQHEILMTELTKEETEANEIRLIKEYKSNDRRYGYNTDAGGSAPGRISDETRKKLAEHMLGDKNPTRRFGHPMKGKKHSEEAKRRMSEAAKARTGRYVSADTRKKLREKQKKVAVIDSIDLKVYSGIHEAAEATGVDATKVCAVCRGKRRSVKGRVWAYYEEWMA